MDAGLDNLKDMLEMFQTYILSLSGFKLIFKAIFYSGIDHEQVWRMEMEFNHHSEFVLFASLYLIYPVDDISSYQNLERMRQYSKRIGCIQFS